MERGEGGRKEGGRKGVRETVSKVSGEREEIGVQREEGGRDFERRFWSLDSAVERERERDDGDDDDDELGSFRRRLNSEGSQEEEEE